MEGGLGRFWQVLMMQNGKKTEGNGIPRGKTSTLSVVKFVCLFCQFLQDELRIAMQDRRWSIFFHQKVPSQCRIR